MIVDTDGSLNNATSAGGTYPILLSEYSTTITNAHQLQLMELNLGAAYTLSGNINAAGTAGGDVWGAQGFIPVGSDATPFHGSLNGNGGTINSLTINSPSEDFVGLFGDMGPGVVDNLNLTNVSVTGQAEVGGIAGLLAGTVMNSSTTGSVNGVDATAGGLVGYNAGTISNSYSTAGVSSGTYIGGPRRRERRRRHDHTFLCLGLC